MVGIVMQLDYMYYAHGSRRVMFGCGLVSINFTYFC